MDDPETDPAEPAPEATTVLEAKKSFQLLTESVKANIFGALALAVSLSSLVVTLTHNINVNQR